MNGLLGELLFADDPALVAHKPTHIQALVDAFSGAAAKIALQIEVMYQHSPTSQVPEDPCDMKKAEALNVVTSYKYLGSTLTTDNRAD